MTLKCKTRQKRKFDLLLSRSKQSADGSQNKEKWVQNYSSKKLSTEEMNVLAKGLNFAPTPTNIAVPEIVASVEDGLRKVRCGEAEKTRITIVGILKRAKILPPNITKYDFKAIKDLRKDNIIMILPADKGRATVVLDKEEYEGKMKSMLSDENTR